jgi:hypothetical protein
VYLHSTTCFHAVCILSWIASLNCKNKGYPLRKLFVVCLKCGENENALQEMGVAVTRITGEENETEQKKSRRAVSSGRAVPWA